MRPVTMPVVYVAIDFNIMSLVQTSMEVQKDKANGFTSVQNVCKNLEPIR